MRITFTLILLLLTVSVRAQYYKFSVVDSTENVHAFLQSRIDSSKVISTSMPDTVLITHGSATTLQRLHGNFYLVAKFFTGNIESPREYFIASNAWAGSGSNPDTLRLIARNLSNTDSWSPHVWDTGTYLYVDARLTQKELQDSVNAIASLLYTGGSTGNVLTWGTPPAWVAPTVNINSKSTGYVTVPNDYVIDATGGVSGITITLTAIPATGELKWITKSDAGAGAVTIAPNTSQSIIGDVSLVGGNLPLTTQGASEILVYLGGNVWLAK